MNSSGSTLTRIHSAGGDARSRRFTVAVERTLFIIKPDATAKHIVGKILAHVEGKGFSLVEARYTRLTADQCQEFYAEHVGKPFFPSLVEFMTSGPVLLCCLERDNAVATLREVIGATDPAQAAEGTIRKLYAESKGRNSVHASDSVASAQREVRLFFGATALAH
jgi:nucleoside-diphosphate kinase